ncbi:TadE/TadG family type IV pilus assembly protein [Pseudomonas sp. NPDC087612]|uniref:TadE/TadG family type IV pilus assembly protein n=1 Tax=unclassified Pseudomonas TaxID=196821 RepID=UPI0005EB902F|nr:MULTISPECIES: TadE/TadG family type IV pilus assembly protein [unclassified Pseudomonas]KJK17946.1 pilus assembly protein TadE [Pseudomonas sp. 2(2015)]NLU59354.1 pilus assembly protein [Pseudomonas sp. BIGb0427]QPG65084.1 pilus assembly protein [Pseudomonas sp. BIGb0427]UVL56965.1 pilus assembly protein [Pseudomonas sp. B21-035]UVM67524.1 pilus assembly protein [Pseudomonas sp. B21-009]
MQASLCKRQKGAAALEFVAVFVIFFAVFYGVVSYGLPMLMLQSFNQASSEAVRRCVALDPASATYGADVEALAKRVLGEQLAWMPAPLAFQFSSDAKVVLTPGKLLTVKINYAKSKLTAVLPVLKLPGIGEVPRLPDSLKAEASLQL